MQPGLLPNRERGSLLLMVMVRSVVMNGCGTGGNNRTGQDRKCKESEQEIAQQFHKARLLHNPAAQSSGRSKSTTGLTLWTLFLRKRCGRAQMSSQLRTSRRELEPCP
jgi:hypothetical protein